MIPLDRAHPVVKICGVQDVATATVAARAGANLLGFMFAESRRRVEPDLVVDVRNSLAALDQPMPMLTAVTVNRTATDIAELIRSTGMDVIQLSGDESPELLDDIDIPVVKTVHLEPGMALDDLRRVADAWIDRQRPAWALLVDAKVPGQYGGTGVKADWSIASLLVDEYPALLAGGLNPGNVAEGICMVRPWGVDVSSGVEIDGLKDHALIESFIIRARQSFAAQDSSSR